MIIIENNEARSDRGLMVRDLGTGAVSGKTQVRPGCTAADFEEVEALPPYTEEQYKARVQELIRERYSADDEFAIQRKYLNALNDSLSYSAAEKQEAREEFIEYDDYAEQCKARAKKELAEWEGQ